MLRYDRQTKPGLVALYDIRPGYGAGPFLQPRSPHGAYKWKPTELVWVCVKKNVNYTRTGKCSEKPLGELVVFFHHSSRTSVPAAVYAVICTLS